MLKFNIADKSPQGVYNDLKTKLPSNMAAIEENDHMKPEGVVLKNFDRSVILKVRYEDYEKYSKNRK